MGVRVKDDSQFKEIYVKALDSMPVGTIVDYVGQASDIPVGWEQVSGQNKIQKTSETRPLASHTVNAYSESESNAYSCDYVNDALDYSTDEVNTHKKWIDGKDIYRKAYQVTLPNSSADSVIISGLNNIEVINISGMATAIMGGDTFKFEINSYHSDTWLIVVYNYGTQIRCKIGNSFFGASANIILEYTKTTQSTRSVNTYSGDIEEKKNIVINDGGEEKPIDDGNNK